MGEQVDRVSHASLNGIYVKAQELDRGQNERNAPSFAPPGTAFDTSTHASNHASDAQTHASDHVDVETHASTHASDAQANATE